MEQRDASEADAGCEEWFCLRTQTKREHIAATMLRNLHRVETYCPRISQIKKTRTGKKRFTEAMFPGYLFARFDLAREYRRIIHTQGVTGLVENGDRRAVPEAVIADLQASLPEAVIEVPDPSLEPGAEVEFVAGSLKGLNGTVLARLPAGTRVQVLLEFLGREITVSAAVSDILLSRRD